MVALSHVLFRTAELLDLEPVVRRAHEVGALVLVDAYQSVGTVPLDMGALDLDRLEPAFTGWFAHAEPFAFDPGPMRRDAGARRFYTGTTSVLAYAAARPGYEIVARIGVRAIREKSLRQTARMIALADESGIRVASPREPGRRGGTVCLDLPHAAEVCHALLAGDVLLDHRPGVGLRLAPHFYTRDDEVDLVMRRVREEARRLER